MNRAEEIASRILGHYHHHHIQPSGDPFRSLIRIILSQNTGFRNERMAYEQLEGSIGVTPQTIAAASVEALERAIRPAGMFRVRGRTIRSVAEAVLRDYSGDIQPVLTKPYDEARLELMRLPGVGKKTADVLLMFDADKAVVPVDRHIDRICKRLEIVPQRAGYDSIRTALEAATDRSRYQDLHVMMIRFGREICRAQRPKHDECFLNDLCPYPRKAESESQK